MKKMIIALIVALFVITPYVNAETIDYSIIKAMTDEDIESLIIFAQSELYVRNLVGDNENVTVLNENGLSIILTTYSVDNDSWFFDPGLVIDCIIVNTSENDYEASVPKAAINGWEVETLAYFEVTSGHKAKDSITLDMEGADISSHDEIETIELWFSYGKPDEFKRTEVGPITLRFK